MKKLKLIFISSIFILSFNSLLAFDDLHAKPREFKEPDKHRIYLRGMVGYSNNKPFEAGELDKANIGAYPILVANQIGFGSPITGFDSMNLGRGLEYRFKDRLRLHADYQETNQLTESQKGSPNGGIGTYTSITQSSIGSLILFNGVSIDKWSYKTSKTGASYYHPINNYFSIGGILRSYNVTNTMEVNQSGFGIISVPSVGSGTVLNSNSSDIKSKLSGVVPGIGIEIKPTRWFEIIYNYESVNLTGNRDSTNLGLTIITARGSSVGFGFLNFGLEKANQTVKGNIQTLDFVFKYTSWFSTRYGFVQETYQRNFDSYLFLPNVSRESIIAGLLYQALNGSEAKFNSFNIRFEFSKGFN